MTAQDKSSDIKDRLKFLPMACDPRIKAVSEYWASLPRTDDGIPLRRHFDPVDLAPSLLPYLWMVDVEHVLGRFRFRLCGAHLVEALGGNPTGRYYDEVFTGFRETKTYDALMRVGKTGQGSWRSGDPNLKFPNHDIKALERVFLPLTKYGSRTDIVLAGSIYRFR